MTQANAAVHARGIDRYRRAEAVADDGDALRVHLLACAEEGERVLRVRHLVEAAHLAALALALCRFRRW
jgi:hypothetical protein